MKRPGSVAKGPRKGWLELADVPEGLCTLIFQGALIIKQSTVVN